MNLDYITETLAALADATCSLPVSLAITYDAAALNPRCTAAIVCDADTLDALGFPPVLSATSIDAPHALAQLNEICRSMSATPEPLARDVAWALLAHSDMTPENGWSPELAGLLFDTTNPA